MPAADRWADGRASWERVRSGYPSPAASSRRHRRYHGCPELLKIVKNRVARA